MLFMVVRQVFWVHDGLSLWRVVLGVAWGLGWMSFSWARAMGVCMSPEPWVCGMRVVYFAVVCFHGSVCAGW